MIPEQYPTEWELTAARSWIADCGFASRDGLELDVDDLDDEEVVLGVSWHYDGGWDAFRVDFDEADPSVVHYEEEDGSCTCGWTFSEGHTERVRANWVKSPVKLDEKDAKPFSFPVDFTAADIIGAQLALPVATIEKPEPAMREVDFRTSDGLDVWLLLSSEGKTYVRIHDRKRDNPRRSFEVPGEDAQLAFEHPYSYLPHS